MAIKIENQFEGSAEEYAAQCRFGHCEVPREAFARSEAFAFSGCVTEPRARVAAKGNELPALHPRQGTQGAWFEVAMRPHLANKPFHKRIIPRHVIQGNLAAVIFSLVGQHYYFNLASLG